MADQENGYNGINPNQPEKIIIDFRPSKGPKTCKLVFCCASLASLTSVLLGYYFGAVSGALIFIEKELKISEVKVEILLGSLNLYSLLGSFAVGRICDWIGRRYTIFLVSTTFFAGSVLMCTASSYTLLMISNLVAGIGVGFAFSVGPLYTAEVSPASSRGLLSTFPEVFMNVGLLLSYTTTYAFSNLPTHLGWRLMVGIVAIPSILLAVGILTMPESPRWLVMQGRISDAEQVLDRTSHTKEEAQLRLADIKLAAGINPELNTENDVVREGRTKNNAASVWKDMFVHPTPYIRHILIAAIGIHFFRQTSGVDAILLYGPTIFQKAGIASSDHRLLSTIAIGGAKLIFVLVATFTIDKIGRRPLLLISVMGMVFSLGGLAVGLTIVNHSDKIPMWAIGLCVTTVVSNAAFFSIGMGPIPWGYSTEIFPLRLRGVGTSLVLTVNRITSGAIVMSFMSLSKAITIGGTFFLFTGFTLVAWVFFYIAVPETKGKTLEEMQGLFGNFVIWKSSVEKNDHKIDVTLEGK